MRASAAIVASIGCSLAISASAPGQQPVNDILIRLSAVDGAPMRGALVALIDARDSVVAEGLSSEAGVRMLRAPAGVYRVRVRRIGYLPFVSSELTIPRAGDLVLNVDSPRVELEGIVVTSKSPCKRTDPDAGSLATVWDEIDKALRSSQLTTNDLKGIGWGRTYRREVRNDGTVVSADSNIFRIVDRRPFGAIDPVALASDGYVLGDENKGWSYFAPDEAVLLSDEFASTHCFRLLRRADRPRQIGVEFEPVPKRKLSDIAGVLWVDQATSELREIVFRFVNDKALSRFDAGGFTRFRRVPSGTWIVAEWKLSVPRLELRQPAAYSAPQLFSIGRVDNGGGIFDPLSPAPPSSRDSLTRKQ